MAHGKFLALGALILVVLGSQASLAATHMVPDEYSTILSALDISQAGDRVEIRPGEYFESDLILPAGVTLAGIGNHPSDVVINAQSRGSILRVTASGSASLIFNLTFKNGWARGENPSRQSGGAIYINRSVVEIKSCRFVGNRADAHGGAIRCIEASPLILGCEFIGNSALTGGGGGLDCSYNASPKVEECTFEQNLAAWGGAMACRGGSKPVVSRSHFYSNQTGGDLAYGGGAMAFFDSAPEYRLCTFYGNRADYGGALASLPGSPSRISHCTMTENTAEFGGGLYNRNAPSAITSSVLTFQDGSGVTVDGIYEVQIACTNLHGNSSGDLVGMADDAGWINGNISADPLFCAMEDGVMSFNVDVESPVVTGTVECGTMGAWLEGCAGDRGVQPIPVAPRILTIEGLQAAPNPFNPSTRIRFELETQQRIRAEIYSINGRKVRLLADQVYTPGWNSMQWNGLDDGGRNVGSGAYLVRLQGEAETKHYKITLLK